MNEFHQSFDVIIAGGGLAGQTLALQLKRTVPEIDILIVDKNIGMAPAVTHRVGESTSELGAYYLHHVLGFREYLEKNHIRKFGFRFFFHSKESNEINERLEMGSAIGTPFPAFQIDRGLFENELFQTLKEEGIKFYNGVIETLKIGDKEHFVTVSEADSKVFKCRWFLDATGRVALLKNKFGLHKSVDHNINAVWFRLNKLINVDDWSDEINWKSSVKMGVRWRSTNHLMGKGYWIWLIPLINDHMSIGIVSDPRIHDLDKMNTIEKSMTWIAQHEPTAFKNIQKCDAEVMDFKQIQSFSYGCKQFVSKDGWAITGDSGTFLDPLYSPGSDFIAMNNTWITDLVKRDLRGEDIHVRSLTYDFVQEQLSDGWLKLYENKYPLFGNSQLLLFKIVWDWATYWSFPCLIYMNSAYTDLEFLKEYSSTEKNIGFRFAALNERIQTVFEQFNEICDPDTKTGFINTFDLSFLKEFHFGFQGPLLEEILISKLEYNLSILEEVWAAMFAKLSNQSIGTPVDMIVNPYKMQLNMDKDELIELSKKPGCISLSERIKNDIDHVWVVK